MKQHRRVLVFGTFDPLHEGHKRFLRQARGLGDTLTVVVARDSTIERFKHRRANMSEKERLAAVIALPEVDDALLGDKDPVTYETIRVIDFDILALGYDQQPDDSSVQEILAEQGKEYVDVIRLPPFQPGLYKSSLMRGRNP